jgi:hypothetical protein
VIISHRQLNYMRENLPRQQICVKISRIVCAKV